MSEGGGLLRVARGSDFRRIAIGVFLLQFAEIATWVGTLFVAYEQSGEKLAGLISMSLLVAAMVGSQIVATRLARLTPPAAAALLPIAQMAMLALAVGASYSGVQSAVWVAIALANSCFACTLPSVAALLPLVAKGPSALALQNTVVSWVESAAMMLGPLAAAFVLSNASSIDAGFRVLLVLAASACALGGYFFRANLGELKGTNVASDFAEATPSVGFRTRISQTFRVPALRTLFVLGFALHLVLGAADVLYLPLANRVGLGSGGAGVLSAVYGAGGLISLGAARFVLGRTKLVPSLIAAGMSAAAAMVLLGISGSSLALAIILCGVWGAFRALSSVLRLTVLQRAAPPGALLACGVVFQSANFAAWGLGGMVPWLAGSTTSGFFVTAAIIPLGFLLVIRGLRHLDARANVPVTEIALLSQVDVLRMIPPQALEALARAADVRHHEKGDALVREGETGSELFVLVDGEVQVERGGTHVAVLGRGDIFGEVAVLKNHPRNATVRATSRGRSLAIGQSDFLTFVGAHDRVSTALNHVLATRT